MKVLFINSVLDYGSTGKIVRDLSNEMKSMGHEVSMVYGRKKAHDEANTLSLVSPYETAVHVIMTRSFGSHGLYSKKSTRFLIEHIKSFQPDVIHLHNLHGYYLHVPMLLEYLASTQIKIIWTLHDAWLISGSGAYYDYNGIKAIYREGKICNDVKEYPEVKFFAQQKRNIRWKRKSLLQLKHLQFITPSQWLKDEIADSFLKDVPCSVVHNGIDLDLFKPTADANLQTQYQDKKVLLGVASKWETRKGLDDFIKLNQLRSDEYVIILIGLSAEEIESLPEGIIGIERTENAEALAAYYTLASAYLNPTYEDNYPTTNLEALACGTRVIAYDTGGNKEVPGIEIVKQGDIEGIWQQIQADHSVKVDPTLFSKTQFIQAMMPFYTEH